MIPATFDYLRPDSVEDAIAALVEHGEEAKLLAGGHSLLPLMKLRLATPSVLVDIGRISGLGYVRDGGDHLAIGALTRHHDLHHDAIAIREAPLLAAVAGRIGDPQVRHRGTIGGSLAHADPASDLPAAVLAMGGTLLARGPAGEREIAAADFFTGFLETVLGPDEILVEIRVSKGSSGHSYQKFVRRSQDWAIVGVAAVRLESGVAIGLVNVAQLPGTCGRGRTGVGLRGLHDRGGQPAAEGLEPSGDLNVTPDFRRHLARVLTHGPSRRPASPDPEAPSALHVQVAIRSLGHLEDAQAVGSRALDHGTGVGVELRAVARAGDDAAPRAGTRPCSRRGGTRRRRRRT